MTAVIGFGFLLLTIATCFFIPFLAFFNAKKIFFNYSQDELIKILKLLVAATVILVLLSQLALIYCYVISDYSIANVYYNSHHLKPLIYKISGSWGNHEGSMLLLMSILASYTFAFTFYFKTDLDKKILTICSQSLILLGITSFVAYASNPFSRMFPIPEVGLGLNPILQDIGLAMHPPMLYTGYIGFSLIFSFAIAGLITGKVDRNFALEIKKWLFFTWGFLTLGIGLGSWWAYRELGWGGYWFWDPVENISLMPWLAGASLVHSLKLLEKKEIFKIWVILLCIISFILCLLGAFLVRSGILTSIHSFAVDAKRGFFIILLILTIGGAGLLVFALNAYKLKTDIKNKFKVNLLSKIGMILINNYFLTLALFIILLGTIYPIFSQLFLNLSISIGPSYYNQLFAIILIPFLFFMLLAYKLDYITTYRKIFTYSNLFLTITAILITAFFAFIVKNEANFSEYFILFLAIWAVFFSINHLWQILSNSGSKFIILQAFFKKLPITLAHSGFALIIMGIIFSSYFGATKEINIKKGEIFTIANYQIEFRDVEYDQGKNYLARQGNFIISKNNKIIAKLKPELRYYPISDQTTYEAAIKNTLLGDLYLTLGNKDENEFYALRIYYKPMIYLIWLGCLMIFGATIIKIRL
jgi:cytochrome c-type biogenesis protein CcmF